MDSACVLCTHTVSMYSIDTTGVWLSLWTPKVGKGGKSLTNPGSGGKGRNLIIPFVRKRLILPYFYSVLLTLAMWNWNKGGFVCNIVNGRTIKQRGVKKCDSFKRWKKSEFMTLQGIPSFRDVFRPLLAGISNSFPTFAVHSVSCYIIILVWCGLSLSRPLEIFHST
jgi:hypothetical protein